MVQLPLLLGRGSKAISVVKKSVAPLADAAVKASVGMPMSPAVAVRLLLVKRASAIGLRIE